MCDAIRVDYKDYTVCSKCLKHEFKPRGKELLKCCGRRMTIERDTSAICETCGKIIFNAVPCATREQCYASGGRKITPYNRIIYFRKWMRIILGLEPVYVDKKTLRRIKARLCYQRKKEPTPQDLKKTLRKLKLQKYNKGISCLLSEITGEKIPEVSIETMRRAEGMFTQLQGKIPYYPDVIYKIFYDIDHNHPLLRWIPERRLIGTFPLRIKKSKTGFSGQKPRRGIDRLGS